MIRGNSRRIGFKVFGATAAVASLLSASHAEALSPAVLTIAPGVGGEKTTNGGAGHEQPTVVSVTDAKGDRFVVVIYMSSNVDAGQGHDPWQCKCSSIRLSPTAPPEIVVDQVLLTQNTNTNRPCNHPFAATDGTRIVWAHGHNENGGNTQTYVQAIDAMCQPVSNTLMISEANKDANQGAPEIRWIAGDQFIAGYYYDGNNDDHTYARGVTLGGDGSIISASYRIAAVNDNSIGRPAIATYGDKALVCASRGDNRPPEDGVACAWINTVDGKEYWADKIVAASDPGNQIYMNQPSLASLGGGRFALQVIESTGQGKNDANTKGSSKVHLYVFAPSDDPNIAENLKAHVSSDNFDVGSHQAHTAIISGKYGTAGETHIGLFGAPITGSGPPGISFIHFNVASSKWDPLDNKTATWVTGANVGDSGKIANLYGANPGKQGRDFMRGIGDVPNPGFDMAKGFMSEVKSFFVLPYAGLQNGEEKNALFLSFVPGETKNPPIIDPLPPPGSSSSSSSSSGDIAQAPGDPSSCACGIPNSTSQTSGLVWLGVGILSLARRRKSGHAQL